ncbi:MAG: SsrA-binding protein SmpB [Chloroflexi bacterium]|nr:SsrA-binding protein SmpB [Chloroflexota bacterium]
MSEDRTITVNRKARFDYDIEDSMEAGLVLTGSEIKAIREGRVNLSDAYAKPENGELWLHNAHISEYSASGPHNNHDPKRPRKLLLHKEQIADLTRHVAEKGRTIVPLKLYITRHVAKVELGLARGRKQYDKRRAIIDREREREAQDAMRR